MKMDLREVTIVLLLTATCHLTMAADATALWHSDLSTAYADAHRSQRPVFVLVSASWCGWCEKLKTELADPRLAAELTSWVLVELDGDDLPAATDRWAIRGLPALRVVSSSGQLRASRDGYLRAPELREWLKQSRRLAKSPSLPSLLEPGPPTAGDLPALAKELDSREAELREGVIRKLAADPSAAAPAVVHAFVNGTLQTRLSALDILADWKAPIADLDPWRPETMTADRLQQLVDWAKTSSRGDRSAGSSAEAPLPMATLNLELDRYLAADESDAPSIRERLARTGSSLLPVIAARMAQERGDDYHQRLRALKYRTAASATLPLRWPGGLERLAAVDGPTRWAAAAELLAQTTSEDEFLLNELSAHPDPILRQFAIRGLLSLHSMTATQTLAALLTDPEPNVRATILKQLAESKNPALVSAVIDYVPKEKDVDLIGHAIRYLKEAGADEAADRLVKLLAHDHWSVRAEAAEAIGSLLKSNAFPGDVSSDIERELWKAVDDADSFVADRAIAAIRHGLPEPALLLQLADHHPERLPWGINSIANSRDSNKDKYQEAFRMLLRHPTPSVRAAALSGLLDIDPDNDEEVAKALSDPEREIRIEMAKLAFKTAVEQWHHPVIDEPKQPAVKPTAGGAAEASETATSLPFWVDAALFIALSSQREAPAAFDHQQRYEDRLKRFRAGEGRSKWLSAAAGPLHQMLRSDDPSERFQAALALAPLGPTATVVAVLRNAVKGNPNLIASAAAALPWLSPADRRELFDDMLSLQPGAAQLTAIATTLWQVADTPSNYFAWALIANERADAASVHHAMRGIDPPDDIASNEKARVVVSMREYIARLDEKAATGPELQRLTALVLMYRSDQSRAIQAADRVFQDHTAPAPLREDAFLISLLPEPSSNSPRSVSQLESNPPALPPPEAVFEGSLRRAVAALDGTEPAICKIALACIAGAFGAHLHFRQSIPLWIEEEPKFDRKDAIVRAGLGAEKLRVVRPIVDAEGKAYVDYLLTLLGEGTALDGLIAYWRDHRRDEQLWKMFVARAVASSKDETRVSVLEEIYSTISHKKESDEFEAAIQSLKGPAAIKLRKKNRQEWFWK